MKKSKSKRDSCPSTVLSARCSSPTVVLDACQCNSRFKELDTFLSNLEIEEHKRMLSQSFRKFKTASDTRRKALAGHLPVHIQDVTTSSFELCPVLHYEGLWKTLSNAFLKVGRSSDTGVNVKPLGETKQKLNPKPGVKKKVKAKSGFKVVPPKTSGFQHNVPVDLMLQVYRDSNIYSKARMRRVDKITIMNAVQSSMNCKQVTTSAVLVEPPVQVPRETCMQVVNLSFHREYPPVNQRNIKIQGFKVPSHHKEQTNLVRSGKKNERSYAFEMVIRQLFPNSGRK